MGPHQDIMAFLTSTEHGAAAWIASRWLVRSCAVRCSRGSLSIRTNIVGTHWLCVIRCRSIAASAASGSNAGMTTTVPPNACTNPPNRNGAAWYSGAGHRYTVSRSKPYIFPNTATYGSPHSSTLRSGSGGRTPLGTPVVPEE